MTLHFKDLPIVGDCIAIKDNRIIWDNIRTGSGDIPFDIADLVVVEISDYDGVLQIALTEG